MLYLGLIFLALTQLAPMLKLEVRMFLKLLSPWTGSLSFSHLFHFTSAGRSGDSTGKDGSWQAMAGRRTYEIHGSRYHWKTR